tara:strand:- start:1979 stop:2230 length:252 start_codon:yes stop_codon:yes gene_type:complete
MKQESSAVIKLTKSEIEMVINALQLTEDAANHFDINNMFTHKIKQDFIKIRTDIIQGEKEIETRNQTKEKNRNGPQACESCDD